MQPRGRERFEAEAPISLADGGRVHARFRAELQQVLHGHDGQLRVALPAQQADGAGDAVHASTAARVLGFSGLSATDPDYRLANAAYGNEDFNREIFTSEIGTVSAPVQSGSDYIIVRSVESEGNNDLQSSYMTSLYPSFFVPYVTQSDLQSSVMASDSFEDNFVNVYFSSIVG